MADAAAIPDNAELLDRAGLYFHARWRSARRCSAPSSRYGGDDRRRSLPSLESEIEALKAENAAVRARLEAITAEAMAGIYAKRDELIDALRAGLVHLDKLRSCAEEKGLPSGRSHRNPPDWRRRLRPAAATTPS
jgi:hypothetical protein